ncbi:MAG: hypothetical protein ACK5LJ_11570 [Paracoccus sp. (in: a-proteobacteria)]
MARPKHSDPELFTVGEIAHAIELSPRNMQLLGDKGLMPVAYRQAEGRDVAALHDIGAFMHLAMVAGVHKAGLPLLLAGQIGLSVPDEFSDTSLEYMSGIGRQGRELSGLNGWQALAGEHGDAGFWAHHWMKRTDAARYVMGTAWDNDIVLLVADRRYALIDLHQSSNRPMIWGDFTIASGATPVCEIEEAAGSTRAIPVFQRQEWKTEHGQQALLNEYRDALRNAVGVSRANISLAIRKALDRVHDLRMEKGGKLFK